MKIGEIKVVDKRFFSGSPASSWDEFLVLERLEDGYRLDIKVYGPLSGEINYDLDEDGEPIYPDEIDGKKIVTIEDEIYIDGEKVVSMEDGVPFGGELMQMDDDTPELIFKSFDQEILDGWLKKIKWGNDEIGRKISLYLT
jgi:hypothetical protein